MISKFSVAPAVLAIGLLATSLGYATAASPDPQLGSASATNAKISKGQRQYEIWERENAKYESDPDNNLKNKHAALRALKRSAELEYPAGLYLWAGQKKWPDVLGSTTPEEDLETFRLLRRSVDLGCVEAQIQLGIAYSQGKGVEKSAAHGTYYQILAAKRGESVAIRNLEYNMMGTYADFRRVLMKSPAIYHARPDYKDGGISFLRKGQEVWEVQRFSDGWVAVYVHQGYQLGYVATVEFDEAGGAR